MPLEADLRALMPRLSDAGIERAIARFKALPFDLNDAGMAASFIARCQNDEPDDLAGIR